jgi:hypothetical protein
MSNQLVLYSDLTVVQAEQVRAKFPANTDPWLYWYELEGWIVVDRYRPTIGVQAKAKEVEHGNPSV